MARFPHFCGPRNSVAVTVYAYSVPYCAPASTNCGASRGSKVAAGVRVPEVRRVMRYCSPGRCSGQVSFTPFGSLSALDVRTAATVRRFQAGQCSTTVSNDRRVSHVRTRDGNVFSRPTLNRD